VPWSQGTPPLGKRMKWSRIYVWCIDHRDPHQSKHSTSSQRDGAALQLLRSLWGPVIELPTANPKLAKEYATYLLWPRIALQAGLRSWLWGGRSAPRIHIWFIQPGVLICGSRGTAGKLLTPNVSLTDKMAAGKTAQDYPIRGAEVERVA